MTPETIGLFGIITFLILMFIGVPVGGALASVGLIGYILVSGLAPTIKFIGVMAFSSIDKYTLSVIPLFVIMGHFAYHANIAADVFDVGRKWFGRIPGGLVQATIAAEAAFGAASGSMMATCAVMSKLTVPEMQKAGVDKRLAYGAVALSSTIDALIPPSIAMAIYGILTETSIGKLLIAGFVPGLIVALSFMILVYVRVKLRPDLAPVVPFRSTWKERITSLSKMGPFTFMVVVVLGGLYTGIFTPTEAGAVGACGMFIMALAMRRLGRQNLRECLLQTTKTTVSIFFILVGAFIFSYFLGICGIPRLISEFLLSLKVGPTIMVIFVLIFYILLGFFMDELAALFITLPIIFPVLEELGVHPIWFGVLMCHVQSVGLVTPPYGLNLFIMKSVLPDATIGDIISGVVWYFIVDVLVLAILIAFPQISLFIVSQMK